MRANERSPSCRVANEERLEEATFVTTAMRANERSPSRRVANEERLVEETTFVSILPQVHPDPPVVPHPTRSLFVLT